MAEAQQQSNATNAQKNHNNPKTIISDTNCIHGHTTFVQYLRDASTANAAAFKQESWVNHQRILSNCNCILS